MKVSVGIDVSMKDFYACIKVKTDDNAVKIKGTKTFEQTEKGYRDFLLWSRVKASKQKQDIVIYYTMEATGTYYENLAYFLYSENCKVSVVLANKIKNYAKSLNVKIKTDKVDSKIIADYGLERSTGTWKPMVASYKKLRDISREILSLKKEINRAKNQLHALNNSHNKLELLKQQKTDQIEFYENMIDELRGELENITKQEPELAEKIKP